MLSKEILKLEINVIIRPRGGNFIYTEEEIKIMEKDIELCREMGVDGVVLGALTEDNNIDEKTIKRFIDKAGDLSITFHMAFDEIEDQKAGLDKLVELGISRVLTKGGKGRAIDNIDNLKKLVDYAGDRIMSIDN